MHDVPDMRGCLARFGLAALNRPHVIIFCILKHFVIDG